MRRPRHLVWVAAVALATLPALAGCGGGGGSSAGAGGPAALPSDSDSERPSDQTPAPGIEQENPQRFIQRWAAAEARMQNTGTTAPYLALSRPCVSCRQLAHTVAGYYAAGGYIHGGAWHIDSIKAAPSSQGLVTYLVRAHTAPMTVRESSSSPVDHVPAGPVSYDIGLLAKGSSFTVGVRTRSG